jgi:hypothetical protein
MSTALGVRFGKWLQLRRNFLLFTTLMMGGIYFVLMFVWLGIGYEFGGIGFWIIIALASLSMSFISALVVWNSFSSRRINSDK